jgi:sugar phosphate isomerase/epimerase
MQLGIFAKTFSAIGARNSLQAVHDAGFECTQFNMACVGLPSLPNDISSEIAEDVFSASTVSGISIAAVSATYNMIHPDLSKRKDGFKKLEVIMRSAKSMGTNLVTLCTGTCDPEDQWRHHPDNQNTSAWRILTAEMENAIALAEKYEVDLGIEPELANVVNAADAARRLLKEMKSKRLCIILDPANLFEVSENERRAIIIQRAIDLLGDDIAMAHAKDRDAKGDVVAAGDGIIDFTHFAKCLRGIKFEGPVITHGLTESEAPGVARLLKNIF